MKYRVGRDTHSWTIEERHVHGENAKEPGKVTWKTIGYYPKLEQVANRMLDLLVKDDDGSTESVESLISVIQEAREDIKLVVKEVGHMNQNLLSDGTRIRFTKKVTQEVSPTFTLLLAEKGWVGEIVGQSDKKGYPYTVKTDRYHSSFVVNATEFEAID